MKTLAASLVTVALVAGGLVAVPMASASTFATGMYGTVRNHTPAMLTVSSREGWSGPGQLAPRTASSFTVGLSESGSATYRITEDSHQRGTVTIQVIANGNDWVTTCVTAAPYACEVTTTYGFAVVTLRGDGSPRFIASSVTPSTWSTLRLACTSLKEPTVVCIQRNDWELEARLAGTTYYLDRVRWNELPAATAGQPYSAPVTNAVQHLHPTAISGLPDGLRYDSALQKVVGIPTAPGATWITLTLMQDGTKPLSSRTAWFAVR